MANGIKRRIRCPCKGSNFLGRVLFRVGEHSALGKLLDSAKTSGAGCISVEFGRNDYKKGSVGPIALERLRLEGASM